MKKIILALLAAAMMLSGCLRAGSADTYMSAAEMAESLAERMRETIDTRTLAGFTRETTFGEAVQILGAERVERAHLVYSVDFLGYPAVLFCYLKYDGNGGLYISYLGYDILISGGGSNESDIEDILAKLDSGIGSHTTHSDNVHKYTDYHWNKSGVNIKMTVAETSTQAGTLASIDVDTPEGVTANASTETPGIFRYKLGADYSTIYQNKIPNKTPERFTKSQICYVDKGCTVILTFNGESGEMKLYSGSYYFPTDDKVGMNSEEYFGSVQKSMKSILGDPEYEHLGPSADTDSYELYMYWPGINIHGYSDFGRIDVDFSEEYLAAQPEA